MHNQPQKKKRNWFNQFRFFSPLVVPFIERLQRCNPDSIQNLIFHMKQVF